jgi:hypothetical protein
MTHICMKKWVLVSFIYFHSVAFYITWQWFRHKDPEMVYNSSVTFLWIIPILYWGQYIIGPLRCRRTCTTMLCYLWLESFSSYTHKRYQLRLNMLFILKLNGNFVPNVTFYLMFLQWVLGHCVSNLVSFSIISFSLTQNLGLEHCSLVFCNWKAMNLHPFISWRQP